MTDDRTTALFFELFTGLPRQGPGDAASTRRALAIIPGCRRRRAFSISGAAPARRHWSSPNTVMPASTAIERASGVRDGGDGSRAVGRTGRLRGGARR